MRTTSRLAALTVLFILAACAEEPKFTKARSDMSKRERDSTIAESRLPGSGVVRKAMNIADAEAQRAAMYDSAGQ